MWLDTDKSKSLEQKALAAAIAFRRKFGYSPAEVLLKPQTEEIPASLAGMPTRVGPFAGCTLMVGDDNGPDDAYGISTSPSE